MVALFVVARLMTMAFLPGVSTLPSQFVRGTIEFRAVMATRGVDLHDPVVGLRVPLRLVSPALRRTLQQQATVRGVRVHQQAPIPTWHHHCAGNRGGYMSGPTVPCRPLAGRAATGTGPSILACGIVTTTVPLVTTMAWAEPRESTPRDHTGRPVPATLDDQADERRRPSRLLPRRALGDHHHASKRRAKSRRDDGPTCRTSAPFPSTGLAGTSWKHSPARPGPQGRRPSESRG